MSAVVHLREFNRGRQSGNSARQPREQRYEYVPSKALAEVSCYPTRRRARAKREESRRAS